MLYISPTPRLQAGDSGHPAISSGIHGIMKVVQLARRFASAAAGLPDRKVAILGAAGGIGQPLGLLMKVILPDDADPALPLPHSVDAVCCLPTDPCCCNRSLHL